MMPPSAVAPSSRRSSRRSAKRLRRNDAEAVVETQITPRRLAAMALWIGTPRPTDSSGTSTRPPPTPTTAPKPPATREARKTSSSGATMPADVMGRYDRGVESAARPGPLAGLRVLELASVLAGPYCAMVLADLGAEVIKVEPLDGDATRGYGPPWINPQAPVGERTAVYFLSVNRNKRSLRLDMASPAGEEVVRRLIGRSDVLVENFRPGGLERLAFGRSELERINPKLVQLSITGYGPEGPDAGKPGYDFVAQA